MNKAKEKAIELVKKYYSIEITVLTKETNPSVITNKMIFDSAKQCALIAVKEIIKALRKDLPEIGLGKGFWFDVKHEIEKL